MGLKYFNGIGHSLQKYMIVVLIQSVFTYNCNYKKKEKAALYMRKQTHKASFNFLMKIRMKVK